MKERKFKIGDKVKVIDRNDPFYGYEGIVVQLDESDSCSLPYKVRFKDGYSWERENDIELALIPKYIPGDRFVIEVESVLIGEDGKPLYKIKGFNALVFDDGGLDRLKREKNVEVDENMVGLLQAASARASLCANDVNSFLEMLAESKFVEKS